MRTLTRLLRRVAPVVVCASLLMAPTTAHGPSPKKIVEEFHKALFAGDGAAALNLSTPQAMVSRQGISMTLEEFVSEQMMPAEIALAHAKETEILDQQEDIKRDAAWVLTRSRTRGYLRGSEIHTEDIEEVVLRHLEPGWRIAHIRWSTKAQHPSP